MAQQILSTNTFTSATWIVNSDATKGTHTTLATALTSASSGDTILLQTSVTENVTLKAGVNIVGYAGADVTPNVSITGKCSFSSAGTVTIQNIRLITNSDNFLAVTGSAASIVNLKSCYLNCSNNTGISFTTSNTGASVNCFLCTGDIGTTGISLHASTSTGTMNYNFCSITNSGSSVTASTNSAGPVNMNACSVAVIFTSSSTGGISFVNSLISSNTNATQLTHGGSGTGISYSCIYVGGTSSAVSIGTGASLTMTNCMVSSSNTNAITGAGTVVIDGIAFPGTSSTINTTTQTLGVYDGGEYKGRTSSTAPSAGMLGEQISSSASSVSLSSNTGKTITSVSLTAGIWDVSAIGFILTSAAYSASQISISTADNTIQGTAGIQLAQDNQVAAIAIGRTLSVPNFRVSLASTTTYYVVGLCVFGSGTASANGRITATRVA